MVYPWAMATRARPASDGEMIEQILARLRELGGRATPARRVLLSALLDTPGHHSAEELAAAVRARAPGVNISTVYRNLEELERLKVVDRTHLGHGPATYHLATTAHGHLVCENCGSMTEIPAVVFTSLAETVRAQYGFTAEPRHFAILGTCANCR